MTTQYSEWWSDLLNIQSRLVNPSPHEQNYSILYQLLAGLTQDERSEAIYTILCIVTQARLLKMMLYLYYIITCSFIFREVPLELPWRAHTALPIPGLPSKGDAATASKSLRGLEGTHSTPSSMCTCAVAIVACAFLCGWVEGCS